MQTLTRRHVVVIEDYDHMTVMNENVKRMKPTLWFSFFSLNLRAPFVHLPLLHRNLIAILDVYNRGKQYLSLMYTMYSNASK